MGKISKEELIEISTTIVEVLAKRLSKQDEKPKSKVAVKKKPREEYVRVQVENRKTLTPTYKIKTPTDLKQEKLEEKLEKERKLKEERESTLVKCSICGEYFHPTSKINTVCSNKICKQINVYNNIIKKHTKLRQEELAKEE